jgi:hypothetical protein
MSMQTAALLALSLSAFAASARASDFEVPTKAPEKPAAAGSPAAEQGPDAIAISSAPSAGSRQELMLNAFRTPSIGLEYRYGALSVHAGAYTTVINDGQTLAETAAWFAKAGVNLWFLPVDLLGDEPSSFYAGASYLNDFGRDGWGHTAQLETGFQLRIYQGFFARLGASALYAPGRDCSSGDCDSVKIRPNPGIGWAFPIH